MGARTVPPLAAFLFSAVVFFAFSGAAHSQEDDAPGYVALGDSLAFGVGANNPAAEGYVGLTEFSLEQTQRYVETGLDVINVSVPGATSAEVLQPDDQLDKAIEEIATREDDDTEGNEVELISIDIGSNDLLALAEADSPCSTDAASQECIDSLSQMLRTLQENVITILSRLREAAPTAHIYIIGMYNPYSGTDNPLDIIANVGVQQVNGVVSAVAADEMLQVRYVSVFELFEGRGTQWIASDGIHPNNDGYRAMAEALLAAIQGRPVSLPTDLVDTPTPKGSATPDPGSDSDGGVDSTLFWIGLAAAFMGGALISSVYFGVRGRR